MIPQDGSVNRAAAASALEPHVSAQRVTSAPASIYPGMPLSRPAGRKPDPHLEDRLGEGPHSFGMNLTTHAVLTALLLDQSLSLTERGALQSALGNAPDAGTATVTPPAHPSLLLSQRQAAELLGVNRTTVWRLTGMGILRPVEISPGTSRYDRSQVEAVAKVGYRKLLKPARLRPAA